MRAAAAVNHSHLAAVFTADETDDGMIAVAEWAGGMTLADRLEAGGGIEPDDFLPNAAGLAGALDALHEAGVVHGGIDTSAIYYSVSHAAKLGAIGRRRRHATPSGDVRDLAAALEEALTGAPAGGPPPSQVIDGLSPVIDRALRRAQREQMTARQLSEAMRSAPTPHAPSPDSPRFSRRLLVAAAILVLLALGLVGLGSLLLAEDGSPALFPPATGASDESRVVPTTTTTTAPVEAAGDDGPTPELPSVVEVIEIRSVDPFGGGDENDESLPALVDGDPATTWRTERYRDPLGLLKPGVGVAFSLAEAPISVSVLSLVAGAEIEIAWTDGPVDPNAWEVLARFRTDEGSVDLQLPDRGGGTWIMWLVDLPLQPDQNYWAEFGEVRFRA